MKRVQASLDSQRSEFSRAEGAGLEAEAGGVVWDPGDCLGLETAWDKTKGRVEA